MVETEVSDDGRLKNAQPGGAIGCSWRRFWRRFSGRSERQLIPGRPEPSNPRPGRRWTVFVPRTGRRPDSSSRVRPTGFTRGLVERRLCVCRRAVYACHRRLVEGRGAVMPWHGGLVVQSGLVAQCAVVFAGLSRPHNRQHRSQVFHVR